MGCNTLGSREYMRVPLPAARMMMFRVMVFPLDKMVFQAALGCGGSLKSENQLVRAVGKPNSGRMCSHCMMRA